MHPTSFFIVAVFCVLPVFSSGCAETSATNEASDTVESGDVTDPSENSDTTAVPPQSFTHKMMFATGENPFAHLAYECRECTFEQWNSIVPLEGWSKGPAQIGLFSNDGSEMRSYPTVENYPDSVDFLEEMPGNEYRVIAITLDGEFIENAAGRLVVKAQVMRDTRLVFQALTRVHELTDPDGNVFVLFAHHVDPDNIDAIDFQSEDAMAYLVPPEGWTYATRILDEELVLDANNFDGVVPVLAIRGDINSTWEQR